MISANGKSYVFSDKEFIFHAKYVQYVSGSGAVEPKYLTVKRQSFIFTSGSGNTSHYVQAT